MDNSVEQHFHGRTSNVREIYDTILSAARGFGRVDEDPKKTSIHLNRKTAFAGVRTRRDFLILTVKATDDINNGRIARSEQASTNRWHHEIKLASVNDLDNQLIDWLRDSYDLSG